MSDEQFHAWYIDAITPCPDPLCPVCDSVVQFRDYDLGTETATGYDNSGVVFHCDQCGTEGEPREVVYRLTAEDLDEISALAWIGVEVLPDRLMPGRETASLNADMEVSA